MINKDRLLSLFTEFVSIDNSSLEEKALCEKLKEKLSQLGISFYEDDTAAKINGTAGNIYAYIKGEKRLAPILLSAHTDSVEPAKSKKAVVHPDGTITSDGKTVLGADDISGICAIIEALTSIKESGAAHRPIELLFDPAEEVYCKGIQQFDFSTLKSKEAYIFDLSGEVGTAAYQAPSIVSFTAALHGCAAHAAFSPEKGVHAIKAAAEAISNIKCGKVEDTTVNVGTIKGGSADNVVAESCIVTGEVRSFEDASARKQLEKIKAVFESTAKKFGAKVDFSTETLCLAYKVEPTEKVSQRFKEVCGRLGLSGELTVTYGGSDNNHFFHHGIKGIVVASGMNNCHSCKEYTSLSELEKAARIAEALILSDE